MFPALVLAAATAAPPNVVLVTIDTLRADHLRVYGNTKVETLTTDRLAREGVLLEDSTAHVPETRPSHGSILTSLYPWQHGIRDNYSPKMDPKIPTLATVLKGRGYATAAFISSYVLNAGGGLNVGFDVYDDPFGTAMPNSKNFVRADRPAVETIDKALAWLERRKGSPFFLWVHLYDPHIPYAPPAPYDKRFEADPYAGEVSYADSQLGRLVKRLDDAGLRGRTLLVVTADHGEGLGDHGEDEHLLFLYDATLRVPLLLSWPGALPAGVRIPGQFRSIDLSPTILELVGAPALPGPSGQSRAAQLRAGSRIPDNESGSEAIYGALHFGYAPVRALRAEGWKYVDAPRAELYNLREDAAEEKNVIESRGQVALKMHERLQALDPEGKSRPNPEIKLETQATEQLAALGYVGGTVPLGGAASGADPKDKIAEYQGHRRAINQAAQLFSQGEYGAALATVRRARRGGMASLEATLLVSRIHLRMEQYDLAAKSFEIAIKMAPHLVDLYLELSRAQQGLKQYDKAMESVKKALEKEPGNPAMLAERGVVLRLQGDLKGARASLEVAKAKAPDNVRVRQALADVYRDQGELKRAIGELKAAVAEEPSFGPGWRALGELYERSHDLERAARAYETAVRASVRDTQSMFALGKVYLSLAPAKALPAFQRVVALDPGYPGISDALKEARAAVPIRLRIIRVPERALAEEIASQLQAGGDFAELARARSIDPSASRGGDLGPVKPSALEPALRDAAVGLAPGQVSAVTQTSEGFAILRREDG